MKKIFLPFFPILSFIKNFKIGLIILVTILLTTEAFASHAAGMDISYECDPPKTGVDAPITVIVISVAMAVNLNQTSLSALEKQNGEVKPEPVASSLENSATLEHQLDTSAISIAPAQSSLIG